MKIDLKHTMKLIYKISHNVKLRQILLYELRHEHLQPKKHDGFYGYFNNFITLIQRMKLWFILRV
jgi:hypothetical protein